MSDQAKKILELTEKAGVLRPRDLDPHGIPRTYLSRLYAAGRLERIGRGLYVLPDAEATENRSLAEAAKRVPNGVICLLSALRFHEITTQAPFEVWVAIGEKAWRPRIEYPRLRIVRFSQSTLSAGVKEHRIEGVPVRVFEPAKTVADCFKYRNKIGLDVAIEALRECWGERRCKMDDLWQFADLCRVRNVMRPYLEALVV
ncbi:MAG: type IV toxin-antitoxin system AbiEi family antitoxin domain-containing protein [Acidiferrobacterales bacterium]